MKQQLPKLLSWVALNPGLEPVVVGANKPFNEIHIILIKHLRDKGKVLMKVFMALHQNISLLLQ